LPEPFTYPPGLAVTLTELMRYEYYVQQIPPLPQHPVYSLLAGRHASRLRGRGLDFEEVRLYVPGDDVRNIDWPVTARTGVTHSKVFNEERERPGFLIADQTAMMFFGSHMHVKSVTAAQVTALTAFYILKRGDRVGGIIFNERGHQFIAPKRSKSHVQFLLQSLADMNVLLPQRQNLQPNTPFLNDILRRACSLVTHDYVVTVISDFSLINDETRRYLRSLSYHNDVMLVHITDPLNARLPDGRLVLGDGRYQVMWQNNRNRQGERYAAAYHEMIAGLTAEFRNYRMPFITIDTAAPAEDQVMKYFRTQQTTAG
jgi:uncharacterized protein (DUF58 family)